MKKYILFFSFLCFLSLPVVAKKKNNSTANRREWEQILKDTYFQAQYTGSLMTICSLYLDGYINKKTKIDTIEFSRKILYEQTLNPKEFELDTMRRLNAAIINDPPFKPCFPEVEK